MTEIAGDRDEADLLPDAVRAASLEEMEACHVVLLRRQVQYLEGTFSDFSAFTKRVGKLGYSEKTCLQFGRYIRHFTRNSPVVSTTQWGSARSLPHPWVAGHFGLSIRIPYAGLCAENQPSSTSSRKSPNSFSLHFCYGASALYPGLQKGPKDLRARATGQPNPFLHFPL